MTEVGGITTDSALGHHAQPLAHMPVPVGRERSVAASGARNTSGSFLPQTEIKTGPLLSASH